MMELTGKQRRFLRGKANRLDPAVMIGQKGLTDGVMNVINEALDVHELIKVRFIDFKDQKKELTAKIIEQTGAALAGRIGHVAIIYRPNADEAKRKIKLP